MPCNASLLTFQPGGMRHQPAAEHHAGNGHVAEPVGRQAQAEDLGDVAFAHAQSRIQPITHGDAADPGAEIEVERIADDPHRQDLFPGQVLANVGAADQVETGVDQKTQQGQAGGDDQRAHLEVGQGLQHFGPFDARGEQRQQDDQREEKQQVSGRFQRLHCECVAGAE